MKTKIWVPNPSYNPDDDESCDEIELEVVFNYFPGYPASWNDPGEGPSIEIMNEDAISIIELLDDHDQEEITERLIQIGLDGDKWP